MTMMMIMMSKMVVIINNTMVVVMALSLYRSLRKALNMSFFIRFCLVCLAGVITDIISTEETLNISGDSLKLKTSAGPSQTLTYSLNLNKHDATSKNSIDNLKFQVQSLRLETSSYSPDDRDYNETGRISTATVKSTPHQGPSRTFSDSHSKKSPEISPESNATSEEACPVSCHCTYSPDKTVDVVNCSHRQLTEIPKKLPPTSREIYLHNNFISDVSEHHFQFLSNLRLLDLSHNNITEIRNDTFQSLSSLVCLYLQSNVLRYTPGTFEVGAFRGLTALESIRLEGNQPHLPDSFTYPDQALAHIPTLRSLRLDGYPRSLGPGFSTLVRLSYLSFAPDFSGYCSMSPRIPPRFFHYLATEGPLTINMSRCEVSIIPPEVFKSLPTIYSLDISHNKNFSIDRFEEASEGLQHSNLSVLNISNNVLTSPVYSILKNTSFRYLKTTRLKILIVERCKIGYIDSQAIVDLPRTMMSFSLHGNYITEQFWFWSLLRLVNLKSLNISNQIDYVSPMKKCTPLLGTLTHFGNRQSSSKLKMHYETAPYQHSQKQNLPPQVNSRSEDATLSINGIMGRTRFSKNKPFCDNVRSNSLIFPLPSKLEWFNASDSKLSFNIPAFYVTNNKVLRILDFSSNNVKCFGGPLYGVPSLQYLDLSRNYCFRLNSKFFSHIPNLRTLLLHQNFLRLPLLNDTIGETFSSLALLKYLDLRNNNIEDLSVFAFGSNTYLEHLDLSHNALSHFRPRLSNNTNLHVLDLSFNQLVGFSESTCDQLLEIKRRNQNFTVRIKRNKFECSCDNLYFVNFLVDHPEIFDDVAKFWCRLRNGSSINYATLERFLPQLGLQCVVQSIFTGVLISFFLVTGGLTVFGVFHYKRWQWRYLYYVGKSRLHLGSIHVTYKPAADVFLTFDQENSRLRHTMRNIVLPRIRERGVTTIVGEVDFVGGPLAPSIAGAVTNTRKTLVFLSPNIFQDHYRRLEVNLAILHELHLGHPVLIPVLFLQQDTVPVARQITRGNRQYIHVPLESVVVGNVGLQYTHQTPSDSNNLYRKFKKILRDFPPEISTFLEGQIHRCIVYPGDKDCFWKLLKNVILEE